jgi:hypothetical protein
MVAKKDGGSPPDSGEHPGVLRRRSAPSLGSRPLAPRASCHDAFDAPACGIHLHHRDITLSGHFFGAAVLLCHQPRYAAGPAEVRQAVEEAASEATAVQRRFAAAEDEDVLAKLRLSQNDIIRLSDAERVRFVAAVAPMVEEQRHVFGNQLLSSLESC